MPQIAAHVWERERPRVLLELPKRMAAAGCEFVTAHLTHLLRNLFYCAALVSMGALPALTATLGGHALLVSEASLEVPVASTAADSPSAASDAVKAILDFVKSESEELYRDPNSLLSRLIKHPSPGGHMTTNHTWAHPLSPRRSLPR